MLLRGGRTVNVFSNRSVADVEKDHENITRAVVDMDPACSAETTFANGIMLKTCFILSNSAPSGYITSVRVPSFPHDLAEELMKLDGVDGRVFWDLLPHCRGETYECYVVPEPEDQHFRIPASEWNKIASTIKTVAGPDPVIVLRE